MWFKITDEVNRLIYYLKQLLEANSNTLRNQRLLHERVKLCFSIAVNINLGMDQNRDVGFRKFLQNNILCGFKISTFSHAILKESFKWLCDMCDYTY